MKKHYCPRRDESPNPSAYGDGSATPDSWYRRYGRKGPRSCTYCGSLHPDDFMDVVRTGSGKIGPTDKNYKVYVTIPTLLYTPTSTFTNHDGKKVVQKLPKTPATLKFYFQHLSEDDRREFVDEYNRRPVTNELPDGTVEEVGDSTMNGKMKIGYPGYLYVKPFFIVRTGTSRNLETK